MGWLRQLAYLVFGIATTVVNKHNGVTYTVSTARNTGGWQTVVFEGTSRGDRALGRAERYYLPHSQWDAHLRYEEAPSLHQQGYDVEEDEDRIKRYTPLDFGNTHWQIAQLVQDHPPVEWVMSIWEIKSIQAGWRHP
jgi:hypothetical protein